MESPSPNQPLMSRSGTAASNGQTYVLAAAPGIDPGDPELLYIRLSYLGVSSFIIATIPMSRMGHTSIQ